MRKYFDAAVRWVAPWRWWVIGGLIVTVVVLVGVITAGSGFGSLGEWVSGLGAFAAVGAALRISSSERSHRIEERDQGRDEDNMKAVGSFQWHESGGQRYRLEFGLEHFGASPLLDMYVEIWTSGGLSVGDGAEVPEAEPSERFVHFTHDRRLCAVRVGTVPPGQRRTARIFVEDFFGLPADVIRFRWRDVWGRTWSSVGLEPARQEPSWDWYRERHEIDVRVGLWTESE